MPNASNAASNVTSGKPKVEGAIFTALKATANLVIPTDTDTALGTGYECVGYISEDGVKRAKEITAESIKAWGGDTVMRTRTANDANFTFKMIEYLKKIVQQVVYGAENVTGDLATGMTIKDKPSYSGESRVWVIDQIMTGNVKSRIVILDATVTAIAEIAYKDNEAAGYEVTLGTLPDASGTTVYEYLKAPAATSSGT
jgi:hypothetical protein